MCYGESDLVNIAVVFCVQNVVCIGAGLGDGEGCESVTQVIPQPTGRCVYGILCLLGKIFAVVGDIHFHENLVFGIEICIISFTRSEFNGPFDGAHLVQSVRSLPKSA